MSRTDYQWGAYLYRKAENEPPQQTKLRHCLKCKTLRVWREGGSADTVSWSPVVMKRILAAIDELLSEERPEDTKVH